jgi:peptide/nickel transport system ATP-binding protein
MNSKPLLEVNKLNIRYQTQDGEVHAVADVSFKVFPNEVFGIAGESGCGKSTLIKGIMRLLPVNAKMDASSIKYKDQEIDSMREKNFREEVLWKQISLVPQSAMNSLNPVYRVGEQIVEAIQAHTSQGIKEARERVAELFDVVGLQSEFMDSFPHEFSGGMRQRAMIAMALALDPGLIVMDEPTTGLDVLVQERILRRILEIRKQIKSSIILITHDIAVIAEMSDRIAVMYGGRIMEQAKSLDLFESPCHPYTLGLKNAFPSIKHLDQELISIPGSPPSLLGLQAGCPFEARCPFSSDRCKKDIPEVVVKEKFHEVSCFRHTDAPELREHATKLSTWHY